MAEVFKLHNQVRHYDWGSPDRIPNLMGAPPTGEPWAELWMGSHPAAPSRVCLPAGEADLGTFMERYGGLPFLFKLLAAEKPLSIQAHPDLARAREGFERENRAGLAPDAPDRNYRDPNHKPEIICALSPFTGMCGFRRPAEIQRLFAVFLAPHSVPAVVRKACLPLLQALAFSDTASALRRFLGALFDFSPEAKKALAEYVLSVGETEGCEWELMRTFAQAYPGDPGMLSPLYLNVFRLEPAEALFLRSGVLHAYIHGFGVELMANSDNVLRGGLTAKYIDTSELTKVLDYSPLKPQIIKPQVEKGRFTYPSPCNEFSLTVMRGTAGGEHTFSPRTASLCIVTEGEVAFSGVVLKQGESAFISPVDNNESPFVLRGVYTLHIASCGA